MEINISAEDGNYMYDVIQKIIVEAGCRMPCSPQETKGAEIIKKELEETCDEVEIEPFKCSPRAFLGWIRIDIILVLLSMGSFFLISLFIGTFIPLILVIISFALNLLAFIVIWNEFFNYREFVDRFFKEKESQNVVGKINAKGEKKHIILFAGHHDSALQFNILRYLKVGYPIILFLGMGVMFLWIFFSGYILLLSYWGLVLNFSIDYTWFFGFIFWMLIISAFPLICLFFFVSSGEKANKVPGAIDNLSAVAIVLGLGRYLKNHKDIIPDNTEIQLISFGCEEAGLRGAYRFAARHEYELKKYDAMLVNMDGIQSTKMITVAENEPTTRTKHSKEMVNKILEASKLVDVKARTVGSKFIEKLAGQISGGTDAAAFSKAGIKATNIMAIELKKFIKFYHQPTDTLDMIDRGSLENVLKICIGFLINESKVNK